MEKEVDLNKYIKRAMDAIGNPGGMNPKTRSAIM
jgi:hypothetical protein